MITVNENRRNQVQTASGLNCLAAIWLFISAFVITGQGPMVSNNLIFGVIVSFSPSSASAGRTNRAGSAGSTH